MLRCRSDQPFSSSSFHPTRRRNLLQHPHPLLLPGHLLEPLPSLPPIFLLSFFTLTLTRFLSSLDGEMPTCDVVNSWTSGDEGRVEEGGGRGRNDGLVGERASKGGLEETRSTRERRYGRRRVGQEDRSWSQKKGRGKRWTNGGGS